MSTDQNKVLTRRVVEQLWNKGDLAAIDQMFTPDLVIHDPANPRVKTRRDYEHMLMTYRRAIPDLRVVIEEQIAERDLVMTWWGAQGTHTGPLAGYPPTGKALRFTGITIDLIRNGQIAESRICWDALGFFQQLGIVPSITTLQPTGVGLYSSLPYPGLPLESRVQ
jgi:steroid delta-isomerase-like uncharacterized protein